MSLSPKHAHGRTSSEQYRKWRTVGGVPVEMIGEISGRIYREKVSSRSTGRTPEMTIE